SIDSIAAALGGTVLDAMPDGSSYLMSLPALPAVIPSNIDSIISDFPMTLPRFKGAAIGFSAPLGGLPWYSEQPAMQIVNARPARLASTGRGVVVADIDSSVDVTHPALRGHLLPGYDFVGRGSDKSSTGATLNQSTASFLDQSTASFL